MQHSLVIAKLTAAFADVQCDELCTLHEAQFMDQYHADSTSAAEIQATKRLDIYTDWREVPAEHLDECDSALSFLSPKGWKFYLPAYLRRALDLIHKPSWETWLPGGVLFHLSLSTKYPDLATESARLFQTLNEAQVEAVAEVLRFVEEAVPPGTSLQEYAQSALQQFWALPPEQRPNPDLDRKHPGKPGSRAGVKP
jgi:hypothetical protein